MYVIHHTKKNLQVSNQTFVKIFREPILPNLLTLHQGCATRADPMGRRASPCSTGAIRSAHHQHLSPVIDIAIVFAVGWQVALTWWANVTARPSATRANLTAVTDSCQWWVALMGRQDGPCGAAADLMGCRVRPTWQPFGSSRVARPSVLFLITNIDIDTVSRKTWQ